MHFLLNWMAQVVIVNWYEFADARAVACNSSGSIHQEGFSSDYVTGILTKSGKCLLSCELLQFRNEGAGQELLRNRSVHSVRKVSFLEAFEIMNECHDLDFDIEQEEPDFVDLSANTTTSALTILPGTKWCGHESVAENYYDLGHFKHLDSCCRQHDFCPVKISGNEYSSKYKLMNDFVFTTVHCKCDVRFLACLRSIETYVSFAVKMLFFRILHPKCLETCAENNCTSPYYYRDGPQRRK